MSFKRAKHMYILSTTVVVLLTWTTWVTCVITCILKFEHHEFMFNHSLIMDWGTPKEKWIGQLNITFMFLFDIYGIFLYSIYAGEGIGGKNRKPWPRKKIKVLCRYYARAVWSNTDVGLMRKAVYASIHHCYSTDAYPQHQYCPEGADSWCFYKRHSERWQRIWPFNTHSSRAWISTAPQAPGTNL